MRRTGMLGVAVLMALALSACTEEGGPTVASAGGTPSASPAGDSMSKELQFVDCMRGKGITDMPDPVPGDASGRSAVRYAIDVMGKGSDDTFQAALDACMSFLPPALPAEPPTAAELDGYAQFSKCMRDNGVAEFPDIDPDGPQFMFFSSEGQSGQPVERVMRVGDVVTFNIDDPLIAAALKACQALLPPND